MTDSNFINELATELKKLSGNHAVGEVWISVDGKVPVGGIPLDGRVLSKTTYSALWNYCKNIAVKSSEWEKTQWKYCDVDTGNFRVPKIDKYLKADESIGVLEAGLPNIQGRLGTGDTTDVNSYVNGLNTDDPGGMFYKGEKRKGYNEGAGSDGYLPMYDFSRANPIYGNSSTVTPETNKILIGVYAFNAIVDRGEADAGKLYQETVARLDVLEKGSEPLVTLKSNESVGLKSAGNLYAETSGTFNLNFTRDSLTENSSKIITLKATRSTTLRLSGATWGAGDPPKWGDSGRVLVLVAYWVPHVNEVVLNIFYNSQE